MGTKSRFNFTIEAFHQGVTGSCILVCVQYPNGEITKFVVDAGLFQEKEYLIQNDTIPFHAENIDFSIITHNHCDHIGRMPLLVKNGFSGVIYTSATNAELLRPAFDDNVKVLKNIASSHRTACLYLEKDVDKTMSLVSRCHWQKTTNFNDSIRITFFRNGHLLGAAAVLVQISYPDYEDINLLFTGDYKKDNIFFDVPILPKWVRDLPLTIISESTYGTTDSTDIEYCFDSNIIEAINNNKTVICPVFSQGRAQEILYRMKELQNKNLLSTSIPIYLDGKLAIKYTERYKKCSDLKESMQEFIPDNFTYINEDTRENIINEEEKKIILCTSGMGSYGPAQVYLPEFITRKNALIHFTGYCAEDTLGNKLKRAKTGEAVTIGGRVLKKSASVEYTSEFSAHDKADELIAFLNQFSDIKMLLINHGTPEVKESFAKRCLDEVDAKSIGVLGSGYTFRIDRYGFVKSLPSKRF